MFIVFFPFISIEQNILFDYYPAMEKILISACLVGEKVRHNGSDFKTNNPLLDELKDKKLLLPICPEVMAGMPVPRSSHEIIGEGGGQAVLSRKAKVKNKGGHDHTDVFLKAAQIALNIAKAKALKVAILKDNSPSCGCLNIYNGSFSGEKIAGRGVAAELLSKNGIKVFCENEIDEAYAYLKKIDKFL